MQTTAYRVRQTRRAEEQRQKDEAIAECEVTDTTRRGLVGARGYGQRIAVLLGSRTYCRGGRATGLKLVEACCISGRRGVLS